LLDLWKNADPVLQPKKKSRNRHPRVRHDTTGKVEAG
jgi:hypothetical protein